MTVKPEWYDVTIRVRLLPQDAPRFGHALRQEIWRLGWNDVFDCHALIDGIHITNTTPDKTPRDAT